MEALNNKERNDAYASFLVFFLITIALLLLAVFFAYRVPFKENERMRKQVKRYEHETEFMNSFLVKMTETKILLDSVNQTATQATVFDGKISSQIKEMNAMLDSDSIKNKPIYQNIIQAFVGWQLDKSQLRSASSTESNLGSVQQQLQGLQMQLSLCEQQKATLSQQLMMYQNQR